MAEAHTLERHCRPGGIVIEVVFEFHVGITPEALEQSPAVPIDDVVMESERKVGLDPGALQLAVHAIGEDIVADVILFAVVLVVAARFHVVHEVVLEDDSRAALVVV